LKTAKGKESGGSISRLQEQLSYVYDVAGNLSTRTNNGLAQSFGVNNLNELTTSSRSGTFTVAGDTTSAAYPSGRAPMHKPKLGPVLINPEV